MSKPFYLSQSMLKDWRKLCPRVWRAKWIWREPELLPDPADGSPMRQGNIFETMVIGAGVNGKAIYPSKYEKGLAFYPRLVKQAEICKSLLKGYGGKILFVQKRLEYCFEYNGVTVYIDGNLDLVYQLRDFVIVIDIKSTGDIENEYGEFAWGKVSAMDMTQMKQYKLLYESVFKKPCHTQYWVFDFKKESRFKLVNVNIHPSTIEAHKEELASVYSEISASMATDYWGYNNTFENCSKCNLECDKRTTFPSFEEVSI